MRRMGPRGGIRGAAPEPDFGREANSAGTLGKALHHIRHALRDGRKRFQHGIVLPDFKLENHHVFGLDFSLPQHFVIFVCTSLPLLLIESKPLLNSSLTFNPGVPPVPLMLMANSL